MSTIQYCTAPLCGAIVVVLLMGPRVLDPVRGSLREGVVGVGLIKQVSLHNRTVQTRLLFITSLGPCVNLHYNTVQTRVKCLTPPLSIPSQSHK